jgi:hypothetical protein
MKSIPYSRDLFGLASIVFGLRDLSPTIKYEFNKKHLKTELNEKKHYLQQQYKK